VNLLFRTPRPSSITDQIQSRLLRLAAIFLFLYCLSLTFAPAVRLHSWNVAYRWEQWGGFAVWLVVFLTAHRATQIHVPERDPFLLPIAALLCGWGLLTLWRLDTLLGLRQSIWLAVCGIALILGLRIPDLLGLLKRYKYLWLFGGLLLTGLTFLFGTYPGGIGPHLWLGLGGVYLQPSEPLKLLLVIYLAAYLADRFLVSLSLTGLLLPTLLMTGVTALLLVAQRDLGTASLFMLTYASVVYLASGKKRIAFGSLLVAGLAAAAGYMAFDVVRLRVDAWINPWADPTGRSYQIVQSLLAFASGGFFGLGPGLGSPAVVPVAQSDFIFAAIAEEMGLVGTIGMILLYAFLLIRGLRIAFRAPEPYQRFLAGGLSIYLTLQCVLIIGGNLRLLPLTGVTLPFVSYGGSSLLTAFAAILLLILVSNHPDAEPAWLPHPAPYLNMGTLLLASLWIAAMLDGWWSIYRSPDLQTRADNPRLAINDRYVRRGTLLDRNDKAIATTIGTPGSFQRVVNDPALSPVIGYTHPLYGQSGLEASLDPYLRGTQGNPSSVMVWDALAYGQPPPGLDVRLSLDLTLQQSADDQLGNQTGGLVLLNAGTGEILAMASHPNFDANQLDQNWASLVSDPHAPLVNRATQGLYPPGTVLGPFLLAEMGSAANWPPLPSGTTLSTPSELISCSLQPAAQITWGSAITSGCPAQIAALGQTLGASRLLDLVQRLGFYSTPDVRLPAASKPAPAAVKDPDLFALGRESLAVSPLQMATAAAGLSQNGLRPAPRLALSVQTPEQGWVILPPLNQDLEEFPSAAVSTTLDTIRVAGKPIWSAVGTAPNGAGKQVAWFIGGTLPTWQGTPIAIALTLENGDASTAKRIGTNLLQSATR
jgi:cell division protein FtsW (lipid II flippase)